ncbi:2-succinyl-6-hydroxy-2,4-cyclohexadiene-1-carboxylate synthase [Bacillus sp. CGMCC 1.16607]|uniref:2-succinyl-6-hydroxy-2, 4-cyclohexadiene-1-carboxylate synthase n=1 Tax=Bacillus sp. CGMCC 1.16607 TaxID=3351842 RepID=UPI003626EF35
MKFLVDDITYHVEICGEGHPLLLLHGFTGRGTNWMPYCSTIGNKAKLIMPDIIGHGLTEHPEVLGRYEIESVAKDCISILDQLGIEQVDLLGYSMGGRLAISLAILFPNRIRKLILESASPGLATEEARRERQQADEKLAHFIKEKGIIEFVDYWEDIPLFQSQKSLPEITRDRIRTQRLANHPIGLINSLLGMGTGSQPSYWENLKEMKAESLFIVGELDQKFCQIALQMQKSLPKAKIYKVKNAGHAIHVEQAEKFGTIVSGFL